MNSRIFTTEVAENTETVQRVNTLTEVVIGCAIEVHRQLGPGLLESAYEICLCRELSIHGLAFQRQKPITLSYKGVNLDCGYRADVIVDDRILVEIKSIDQLAPIHDAQLLSYLKLTGLKIGLLINFNVRILKQGIRRKVLGPPEEISL
jgi:GxxExxY protein